jgi:hypothetical protein
MCHFAAAYVAGQANGIIAALDLGSRLPPEVTINGRRVGDGYLTR